MRDTVKFISKILFLLFAGFIFNLPSFAQAKHSSRILLIPLDDRPPCFQWVVKMGEIGDAEVVAPPRELLGKFTEFGKSDEIIDWVKKQNLKSFDAAVISIDMLAYGGLVAMREYEADAQTAQKRLAFIREIKKSAPQMKIYAASVIMRLAPTGNVTNESYRVNLAKWAEISVDPNLRKETAELEKKIPADALQNYKSSRIRDLQTNLAAIKLVQDKVVEQLILGQDDAKPKGVHVADRERLISEVNKLKLQSKIGVQPGADELSMLSLARALGDKYDYQPKIKAIYSSDVIRNQVMPYEDRPLHQTVSFQIESIGAKEVQTEAEADILFFVYASRFEKGRAESFAEEIATAAKKPGIYNQKFVTRKFIIADVDPKGDVQGADPNFTRELLKRKIFLSYAPSGYAAWNTAGNTVGTALPHGVIFSSAYNQLFNAGTERKQQIRTTEKDNTKTLRFPEITGKSQQIARAQLWFTMNRLLDDYVYHSLVRPEAGKFIRENNLNSLRLATDGKQKVENFIRERMSFYINSEQINRLSINVPCCFDNNLAVGCGELKNFSIYLPWDRTFEAELNFDFERCTATS